MKHPIIIIIILLTFFSCNEKKSNSIQKEYETVQETAAEAAKKFKPNKNLIDFKIGKGLSEDEVSKLQEEQLAYLNSEQFNPKTDTINYKKDEIYISYLTFLPSGPEYRGDFKIENDSLILEIVPFTDVVLSEQFADRIVFKIANPSNKKFKVKKGI
ncbi:hypothetical protein [Flavobacterium caeni]|uniref:Lipoprotein n=1 Tax=Flavobacterium caeni TaxID=490189 RepID=A0A1G5KFN3_9FLAO|nr:hypothetical protein [Flavobacterium caeni]SCY99386.1 hypothetical protein SAMN02927903_03282 [Flavobacterium caeni]